MLAYMKVPSCLGVGQALPSLHDLVEQVSAGFVCAVCTGPRISHSDACIRRAEICRERSTCDRFHSSRCLVYYHMSSRGCLNVVSAHSHLSYLHEVIVLLGRSVDRHRDYIAHTYAHACAHHEREEPWVPCQAALQADVCIVHAPSTNCYGSSKATTERIPRHILLKQRVA
jgi:hypothetical protein